jgi:hypothetical protein
MLRLTRIGLSLGLLSAACSATGDAGDAFGTATENGETDDGDDQASDDGSTGEGGDDDDTKFDVGVDLGNGGDPPQDCDFDDLGALQGEGDPPACSNKAPAESFDPVLEWSFGEGYHSMVTPLVANLTDDNDDGVVDLCDTPDVVLPTKVDGTGCVVHVLDGATGNVHHAIQEAEVDCAGTPALADIDDDGVAEILIASAYGGDYRVKALEVDGTEIWDGEPYPTPAWADAWVSGAASVADIDADGTPEVMFNHAVWDGADGSLLWSEEDFWPTYGQTTFAIDLDDDGDLEVITGTTATDFDDGWNATTLWDLDLDGIPKTSIPQAANFDDDPEVELLYATSDGFVLVEHDGTYAWGPTPIKPANTLDCIPEQGYQLWAWMRPAAIVDFDDDGKVEVAVSSCDTFAVYEVGDAGLELVWETPVTDNSGASGATAFDFLGDAYPEPVYSDEVAARAWSGDGMVWNEAFSVDRRSGTMEEYPVVADVDNDGSAEFLVVSWNEAPVLQVFGDADSRWVQARRIWNQHAYMVTNIRENGTLPEQPLNHWEWFNTFRVNAPIQGGGPCKPAG